MNRKVLSILLVFLAQSVFSQSMSIHKKDKSVVDHYFSEIDSITFSLQDSTPTTGLVAYFPFDGNAIDASGHGNIGTVNGASLTHDRFGKENSAYSFNGIDNSISVAAFSHLLISNFSVSLWLNSSGDAGGAPDDSFIEFGKLPNHTWNEGYDHSKEAFTLWDVNSGSWYPAPTHTNGHWTHVVIMYSYNSKYLYVNGQLIAKRDVTLPLAYKGSSTLTLGSEAAVQQWITGDIDDVRIYIRALTEREIQSLFHEKGW
jgi:hypothetical protein